jgi:hypothetical protein
VFSEGAGDDQHGGLFPTCCTKPIGRHYVTTTLPDGRSEVFDMGVSPECQPLVPPEYVRPTFTARPGTFSTLEAKDAAELF